MSNETFKVHYEKSSNQWYLQIHFNNDEFRIIQLPLLPDEAKDIQDLLNKNSKPSEALECLEKIEKYISDRNMYEDLKLESNIYYNGLGIIKQALIKSQELEKDKIFLKNIGNTKVKVPLADIFNGLPQVKRFAYTEHIYYHWEEMKESLEEEIKTLKDEKENLESKAKKQEKVLEIIKEKCVEMWLLKDSANLEQYNNRIHSDCGKLTQEEFDTLKRWC